MCIEWKSNSTNSYHYFKDPYVLPINDAKLQKNLFFFFLTPLILILLSAESADPSTPCSREATCPSIIFFSFFLTSFSFQLIPYFPPFLSNLLFKSLSAAVSFYRPIPQISSPAISTILQVLDELTLY